MIVSAKTIQGLGAALTYDINWNSKADCDGCCVSFQFCTRFQYESAAPPTTLWILHLDIR
jgi:hypothetical protein